MTQRSVELFSDQSSTRANYEVKAWGLKRCSIWLGKQS
jgi:hypothetical protein